MNATHIRTMCAAASLPALIASLPASAVTVEINVTGVVGRVFYPLVEIGDKLSLTLVYEVDSVGACKQTGLTAANLYVCLNNVTFAKAIVGDLTLSGLMVDPNQGIDSKIEVAHTEQDQFQAQAFFRSVSGISRPGVNVFFDDSTGTTFGPNPRLPTMWSEQSLLSFDSLSFNLVDLNRSGQIFADGILTGSGPSLVPEPSVCWLLIFGLAGLGLQMWKRRPSTY